MRKKVGVLPHDIFAKGFFKGCHHNINLVYRLTGTFFHIPTILECAILNVSIKMYASHLSSIRQALASVLGVVICIFCYFFMFKLFIRILHKLQGTMGL